MKFIKRVLSEFSNDRCPTLAAALAYYTAFALPPLLYLLLTVLTFGLTAAYGTEEAHQKAQGTLEQQTAQMLGNEAAADEIATILEANKNAGGIWWKTLISFAGILVGATGVVAALQDSLNRVWQVQPDPENSTIKTLIGKRLLSLAMILGLGFLLLVSMVLTTVLSAVGEQVTEFVGIRYGVASTINYVVQSLVMLVIFAALFKIMPDAEVEWRDVLIGTALTTVLFLIGRFVMQFYFSISAPGAQLGSAAASFAVILVWIYYNGLILLLGAEATQVYASMYGNGIRPSEDAVHVVQELRPRNPASDT